ncbi:MAG: hypothetical protein GQ565_06420 [Candidatus Aegiribacteria sp.]|nr:hypothetical protein [Candidatus Aegiribacteria sp.]
MKLPIWQKCILPGMLLILVILTYWPVFNSAKLPGGELSDTVSQGYPFFTFTEKAVQNGRLPHWNPYIFCGVPFYSSFSAPVFYPVRGLLLLLSGTGGVARFLFPIHMLFGGIFAWLFLRSIGVSKWGRIVGALAFACTSWSNTLFYAGHASKIICWSFLPLLLYSCEKWMQTRKGKFIAIGGLALGMQSLASHPQMILYSTGAALIWLGFRTFSSGGSWKVNTLKALMGFSSIMLLAVAIGAVQLLPAYNFSKYSTRGDGLSFDQAASYSLPPEETLTMLFPKLFGYRHGFPGSSISGVPLYFGRLGLRLSSEFVGISVFLLALAGFMGAQKKYRWPLLTIMAAGLLVSWGGYTPLFEILYRTIPFFRKLRAPHMAAFLTTTAIALAAGPGFDAIFVRKKFNSRKLLFGIAAFSGTCILVYLLADVLLPGLQSGWWNRMGNASATGYSFVVQRRVDMAAPDFLKAAGAALVICGLLFFRKQFKERYFIPGMIIIILLAIELVPVDRDFQVYLPQTDVNQLFTAPTDLSEMTGEGRLLPGGNDFIPFGIRSVMGYHAAKPAVAEDLQMILSSGGIAAFRQTAFTVLQSQDGYLTYEQFRESLILQTRESDPSYADTLEAFLPEKPLPRAWFAESWVELDENRCLSLLASGLNPQEMSVLYGEVELPEHMDVSEAEVTIVTDEAERVVITTSNSHDGLLVLADLWYPRWQIRIDGNPVPMLQANHWQRGVVVPSGFHEVEFSFDSSDVTLGLIISIIGILAVLLIVVFETVTYKRRERLNER